MRYIIILSFVILSTSFTFSQIINNYGFKAGICTSYEVSETKINHEKYSSESRVGIDAGLYAELLPWKNFHIVPEVHFIQKGMKFLVSPEYELPELTGEKVNTTLNYFSFPLLAKLNLPFRFFSAYLVAGPRYDILLSKDENIINGYYREVNNKSWGYIAGAGFTKKINNKFGLLAEFRFNKELSSFRNTGFSINGINYSYFDEVSIDISNTSMQFLLGIYF